jgi:geranylgeranyl diphosphate synthase type II
MQLKQYLETRAALINKELVRHVSATSLLDAAMRYSLTAGGKRLRPILVLCAAEICGGRVKDALPAACAVEYIHTYSLIHDDLPAMDNDDLRRGKPTSHKKFGEATAILAGDALLTEAFGILAECSKSRRIKPSDIVKAVKILSREAGKRGMVDGQLKDTVESGKWSGKSRSLLMKKLKEIHMKKTAALISASLEIGAALSGAGEKNLKSLRKYGQCIGLAFQVTDDILDIEGNKILLGKKGSDRDNNKLTYPSLYGLERSKQLARQYVRRAKAEASGFGARGRVLSQLADYILTRKY